MVYVCVDEDVKREAAAALEQMGLSVLDAAPMLQVRVATEKRLPLEVRIPGEETDQD